MSGCGRCDGGWIEVDEAYIERQLAKVVHRDNLDAETLAEQHRIRRRSLVNSYRPCPDCRPVLRDLWDHGCLEPDHYLCDHCREPRRESYEGKQGRRAKA